MSGSGSSGKAPESAGDTAVGSLRSRPSEAESWRVDPMAGSRHSRLGDQLAPPVEKYDLHEALGFCAAVCRQTLRDFAPGLILLPRTERWRAQALAAYVLTLFDFVHQTSLEGERLAAVNRWEFDLEQSLAGRPPGQPIFLVLAEVEKRRAWPPKAFDRLHTLARRRCAVPRPRDRAAAEREARDLGAALAWLLTGQAPTSSMIDWAGAVVRLRALLDLGEDLRRHRARLPASEVPESWDVAAADPAEYLDEVIAAEIGRIAGSLSSKAAVTEAPSIQRRALRYVRLAALQLGRRVATSGTRILVAPPHLGPAQRLVLLARCRWSSY